MSTETQEILKLRVVTDCDTGMSFIGEVEGGFDSKTLERWVQDENFCRSVLQKMAYLQFQIMQAIRDKPDKDTNEVISAHLV